jgi:hypothetical protein
MALLGCSGWEIMWTNLVATAVFELSEALQRVQAQQSTQKKSRQNDIFTTFARTRFLDKVLDKPRRQSASIADLSRDPAFLQGQFSRFYAVEDYIQTILATDSGMVGSNEQNIRADVSRNKVDDSEQEEAARQELLNQVLNRMTFVQVQEVFEDHISLVIHLTDTVQLSIQFQLVTDEATQALQIDEIDTKLVVGGATKANKLSTSTSTSFDEGQCDDEDDSRIADAQENAIAIAYYGEFMAGKDCVLGNTVLETLINVSEIPGFVSRVTSHVNTLRKVLQFVRALHMAGGLSMVTKQQGGRFSLNMDHIELADPIAVDLRVLVCTMQIPSVFRMINDVSTLF